MPRKKTDGSKPGEKTERPKLPAFGTAEEILKKSYTDDIPHERRSGNPPDPSITEKDFVDRRINRPLPPPTKDSTLKFVSFYLNVEEYALSIFQVREINRVDRITKVPNSPDYVLGVINLRGKIIPVIDLKKKLNLGQTKIDSLSRIVIIENSDKIIGLLVDRVTQVINLMESQIEGAPEEVIGRLKENYIKGVGKLDDRMIILLDLTQLVEQESKEEKLLEAK